MTYVGNRIIFNQNGEIIFEYGEMQGDVLDRDHIEKLDYIDIPYGFVDYNKCYIESVDVETKQPIIKEYPTQELTQEQQYIKELEERLAHAESQLISTIPELSE